MKKGKVYSFNELMKPYTKKEKEQYKELENAYRRGYRHAYSQAIDDFKNGFLLGPISRFFNNKIMNWSYFKDEDSKAGKIMVIPPSIKRNLFQRKQK